MKLMAISFCPAFRISCFGKLVEKKQLAFIHHDFFSIDDIGE